MMIRSIALTVLLSFSLCACARSAPSQASVATTPTQQRPPTHQPQSSAAAAAGSAVAGPQSESQQAAEAQEKAGEAPEVDRGQTRSDAALERLAQLSPDQQLPGGRWKAGVNYDPLVPSQPTGVGPGKVEVVEVFWLGCPHCYALEPYIQSWLKNKPEYIEFVRVPVMWGPVHRAHAKLYYTLVALNRQDLLQKAFETIQQQHQMLVAASDDDTLKAQLAFAKDNGISPDKFTAAYNSFSVASNLQRAEQLTQRYHVEGVPLMVIDGKFTTDVSKAGGPSNLLAIVDDLAAAERHH
jgi:thiol:disulfide interchange protein DsbA